MNVRITDLLDCYYDDTVELLPPEQLHALVSSESKAPKKKAWFRFAAAIAILGSILVGASVTALAVNHNLWDAVAQWTSDIFHFSFHGSETASSTIPSVQVNPELEALNDALIAGGVSTPQLPGYLPEGYLQDELTVSDNNTFWGAAYARDGDYIMISITQTEGQMGAYYLKDDMSPVVYSKNGTDHYIMTNMGKYIAVWTRGTLEYAIIGAEKDELYKMIDSIYESMDGT